MDKPVTVSELNEYLKTVMDGDGNLSMICVEGEISGYTAHYTGHSYFTLKDKKAAVKAVMFKGYKQSLNFAPQNGMTVMAIGDVSVFPRDGVYQLYVKRMIKSGIGDIFLEMEELKAKLAAEGLFDEANKKPLPDYPEKIAVITSPTGAALQDIKNVIGRRFPLCSIELWPVLVQCSSAAADIAEKLAQMDEKGGADVAILARGGGSVEDLFVFNDERIARAIYALKTPLISAIGHETDFTIADFVSDRRAPTPSAAAEIAVPDIREVLMSLSYMGDRLNGAMMAMFDGRRNELEACRAAMDASMAERTRSARADIRELSLRLRNAGAMTIADTKSCVDSLGARLGGLDPAMILMRGYASVLKDGKEIRRTRELAVGDDVDIRFFDGTAKAVIVDLKTGEADK